MYKGVNALIQGGCADLLSIAAMRVDEFNDTLPSNHLVNLVHDETITECLVDDLLPSIRNIAEIMKVPDLMGVPFATDVKIGPSYGVMGKVAKELYLDPNTTHIDMGSILSEDGEYLSSDDPDEEEEEEAEIAE